MPRICEFCGKRTHRGRKYTRRGLPKKKGGIGLKTTGKTLRRFRPNVQAVKIREANGTVRTAKVCAKCLKTGIRRGTLHKAGKRQWRLPREEE